MYVRIAIKGAFSCSLSHTDCFVNGMCIFKDGTRAATAARKRTPSLTISTSDCAVWVRSWRTKRSDIMREMPLSMRVLSVAPRRADAVDSLKVCRGGTAVGETREEGGCFILEYTTVTLVEK